jgi:hypothetical protein
LKVTELLLQISHFETGVFFVEVYTLFKMFLCLARDSDQWRALVNTAINFRLAQNVGKFLSGRATGGFSRRAQLQGISNFPLYCQGLCLFAPFLVPPLIRPPDLPIFLPPVGLYCIILWEVYCSSFFHEGYPLPTMHLNILYHFIQTMLPCN